MIDLLRVLASSIPTRSRHKLLFLKRFCSKRGKRKADILKRPLLITPKVIEGTKETPYYPCGNAVSFCVWNRFWNGFGIFFMTSDNYGGIAHAS